MAQLELHKEYGLIGGVWGPDETDQSFLKLGSDLNVRNVVKAASVLEMILWDPSSVKKTSLPACTVPIETNFSGPSSTIRGCVFFLELMGKMLNQSGTTIRALAFDAHGSHSLIRRLLFGQVQPKDLEEIKKFEFWNELSWQELPCSILPRLPVKLCIHRGDVFFPLPGVCSLAELMAFACFCNLSRSC